MSSENKILSALTGTPAFIIRDGNSICSAVTGKKIYNISPPLPAVKTYALTASTWTESQTYADYGYACVLSVQGVTATSEVDVIFGMTEATSGNYAPVCDIAAGTVTIYSKVNDSISVKVRVY